MKDRVGDIIREYDAQGDHRTGTVVDEVSGEWLAERIKALGVRPELDAHSFNRVEIVDARLTIGDVEIPGVPLFDCHYTGAAGVRGTLGELGSDADIGVVMLLPFNGGPVYESLEAARRRNRHRAIVLVTDERLPADGVATLNAEDFRAPLGPPVLQIPNARWERIQAAMQAREQALLVAQCERVDAVARNVQATIEGSDPGLAPVVVMTPRSGWWSCASERGGGIAAFLEIMRALKHSAPARNVIFTANTGHELGHTGLDHYLEANHELIAHATMWLHLGANFAARVGGGVRLQYSDAAAREAMQAVLEGEHLDPAAETLPGTRPAGEARNIFDGGGRYISILGNNGLFHHPRDRWPDAVDVDLTARWVKALADLSVRLARNEPV